MTDFSTPMKARVFKFCIHLESGQVCSEKENQDAKINFTLLFAFFLFSISHSNVMHREICVKDFSGTTMPRILTFGTNVGYGLLYCVKENQPHALIIPFICPFYFYSPIKFSVTDFSAPMRDRVFKFGERTAVVCECLWFWKKIKLYQILLFSPKNFLIFSIL